MEMVDNNITNEPAFRAKLLKFYQWVGFWTLLLGIPGSIYLWYLHGLVVQCLIQS